VSEFDPLDAVGGLDNLMTGTAEEQGCPEEHNGVVVDEQDLWGAIHERLSEPW